MIIKNCVELENGGYDFDFNVDEKEAAFLMDHAIKDLIRLGIIHVASEEEQFLAQAEVDDLIKDGGKLQ